MTDQKGSSLPPWLSVRFTHAEAGAYGPFHTTAEWFSTAPLNRDLFMHSLINGHLVGY